MFSFLKPKVAAEQLGVVLVNDYVLRHYNLRDVDHVREREFAREHGIDEKSFQHESLYVRLFLIDFIVTMALGSTPERKRVLDAFYARLTERVKSDVVAREQIDKRFPRYKSAVDSPHPEHGIVGSLGEAFAESCGVPHDPFLMTWLGGIYGIYSSNIGSLVRGVRIR